MCIKPFTYIVEDTDQCLSHLCIPCLAPNVWGISRDQQIFYELKIYGANTGFEFGNYLEAFPSNHVFISNSFDGYIFLDSLLFY